MAERCAFYITDISQHSSMTPSPNSSVRSLVRGRPLNVDHLSTPEAEPSISIRFHTGPLADVPYTFKNSFTIGRSAQNDIVISNEVKRISKKHLSVEYDENGYWIVSDLGSTQGTYVHLRNK